MKRDSISYRISKPSGIRVPEQVPREEIIADGHSFFREVVSAIDRAQGTIDVETYIMVPDEVGNGLFAALQRAAARGVAVRLVVDGFGSAGWLSQTDLNAFPPGLHVGVYHPVPVMKYYFKNIFNAERTVRALMKLNRRNHKKLIVIDDREVFAGSFNLWRESLQWKELFLRTRLATNEFKASFEFSWSRSRILPSWKRPGRRLHISTADAAGGSVLFNFSYRTRHRYLKILTGKVLSASRSIWLMTPYFVPPISLLNALCDSAARGVDVRLALPNKPDHAFMKIMARYYYSRLLESGVRIYEYKPEMLHAKAVLVDGEWAVIGSSNINHRSFFSDLEIMILLQTRQARADVQREFESAFSQSTCLTEISHYRFPLWKRLLYRVLLATRRWI